jgi:hypothetical protein
VKTIRAVVRDRRIETAVPDDIADGTEVEITVKTAPNLTDIEFMTEDEQGDDGKATQQWCEKLKSLPPVPYDPIDFAGWEAWQLRMKQFNIEQMRGQFSEETL